MIPGGAELPFPIECNTDECIVIKRSATVPESSITCTIELKRHVVKQSLRQALTQFVCALLKSNLPVISTLTDMTKVGIAYYTTGEKTPDGWTIITQRFFPTAKGMMQFLSAHRHQGQLQFAKHSARTNLEAVAITIIEPLQNSAAQELVATDC